MAHAAGGREIEGVCRRAAEQVRRSHDALFGDAAVDKVEKIVRYVDAKRDAFVALSDHIWRLAEIRFKEHQSAAAHVALLEEEGFQVTRRVAGIETAFVAESGAGRPVIGFLGEYDGLAGLSQDAGVAEPRTSTPGAVGHGCGHNLLGAGAALAAVALRNYLMATGLTGTVRFYGCPAEEGGSGKSFMARAGAFDDLDAAVSWHPGCFAEVMSRSSLANFQVYWRFTGRASHAAGAPHLGRSALDAVELMNIGVNFLREHMPASARVHYSITDAGGVSPNVVQPRAEVLYLIRAPEVAQARALFARVRKIAEGAALMAETQAEFEIDKACSNIVPNMTLAEAMHENLSGIGPVPFDAQDVAFAARIRETLTPDDIAHSIEMYGTPEASSSVLYGAPVPFDPTPRLIGGSTDVGDVSWIVPTVQMWGACFAVGTPGHSWQLVAQGTSPAAHKGMVHAAKVMAATALDAFSNPALLERAKAELRERVGGGGYRCPIPDDVVPPPLRAQQRRR
ncbi:MAG TPA: M20 family metallopeptidase [bacterium]|nr:M20 family metallopeptidase [bacterium]